MMEFLRNDHQPTDQPTHKAGSRDAIASKNVSLDIKYITYIVCLKQQSE